MASICGEFLLPDGGLAGGVLALMLARLPEPEGFAAEERERPLVQIGRVIRRPWAVAVVGIAMVEGAVILGFLTFLAPALEHDGFSPAAAGLAVGLYGLAVLGWTRAVKMVSDRLGPAAPLAEGGRFGLFFATAAVVAVPLGIFAALARRRYAAYRQ